MYTGVKSGPSNLHIKSENIPPEKPEKQLPPEEEAARKQKIEFDRESFLQLQGLYKPQNILYMKPVYLYSFNRFSETKEQVPGTFGF
jgi:hypothetical protein